MGHERFMDDLFVEEEPPASQTPLVVVDPS